MQVRSWGESEDIHMGTRILDRTDQWIKELDKNVRNNSMVQLAITSHIHAKANSPRVQLHPQHLLPRTHAK